MKEKIVAIGIDIGGTEIKYGLVLKENNEYYLINHGSVKTPKNDVKSVVEIIFMVVDKLQKVYPNIDAVGIGVAGIVDNNRGKVFYAPNLKWENINLKKILLKKIKVPLFIDNDANFAAIGTHSYELKKRYKNLVCLTLGTGVGGGIIIDNKIYNGYFGLSGEFGHMTIYPDGERCNCGNRGCLERYVGSQWFLKMAIKKIKENKGFQYKQILSLVGNDINAITTKTLYLAARKNNVFAKNLWSQYGKYLGILVANIVVTINPQIIVFAGGLSGANKYFLPSLKKEVNKRVFPLVTKCGSNFFSIEKVKYYCSSNTKTLGILGAAIYTIENIL